MNAAEWLVRSLQSGSARGVFIEGARQLGPAIREGLAQDTVTLIHVPTELGGIDYQRRRLAGSTPGSR